MEQHTALPDEPAPEALAGDLPPPLAATDYPLAIHAFGALVLGTFLWAVVTVPHDIGLARELRAGEAAARAGDQPGAERHFVAVLKEMPNSKDARLGFARAVFTDADAGNNEDGLAALEGLTLDDREWRELSPAMPAEYRAMFQRTEGN